MKNEKIWNRIAVAIMVMALVFTSVLAYYPKLFQADETSTLYASSVFDKTKIMNINIIMDEDDWKEMLENAESEEYSSCDIEINGTRYNHVGIRPKGNTSLRNIVEDDTTDRYSFKVEFNHFQKGQSLDGLDKLSLNNIMADSTYMKEYITYDILSYLGVNSSLYSYASIHHNGEYWGLYMAFEAVEESFLQRTYNETDGKLYKPESIGGGKGGPDGMPDEMKEKFENMSEEERKAFFEKNMPEGQQGKQAPPEMPEGQQGKQAPPEMPEGQQGKQAPPEMPEGQQGKQNGQLDQQTATEEKDTKQEQQKTDKNTSDKSNANKTNTMPNGGPGGGPGGGMGSDLAYIDDNYDSYDVIWDSSIIGEVSDADKKRLVTALKNISNKENIDTYLDVDQMLRYIAANVFVSNDDSYFGNMLHNYYLYEKDGKLCMLPWDYNLAFGGMSMGTNGDATQVVNRGIDDVISNGSLEERPMLAAALYSDENMEQYHQYLKELIDGYFSSGIFEATAASVKKMITPYIKSDPTAFYTVDEFEKGYDTLMKFIDARVESIRAQLKGEIPAKASERTDSNTLVDGSDITLSDMGTMFSGKGGMGFPEGQKEQGNQENKENREGQKEQGNQENKENREGQKEQGNQENKENREDPKPDFIGKMQTGQPQADKSRQKNGWILTGISGMIMLVTLVSIKHFKRRKYRAM